MNKLIIAESINNLIIVNPGLSNDVIKNKLERSGLQVSITDIQEIKSSLEVNLNRLDYEIQRRSINF